MKFFELDINFSPDAQEIETALEKELSEVTTKLFKTIHDDAPDEMQAVMLRSSPTGNRARGGGFHSAEGQPPAVITKTLLHSLHGVQYDDKSAEIEMAYYGFYLDPIFKGQGKGGGYLNRPFIEVAIDTVLNKAIPKL